MPFESLLNPAITVADDVYGQRVSMLAHGAVADGTTDDLAAFVTARTAAGADGVVHFPAKPGATETTYYFAGNRPDLSGTQLAADPSVIVKVDENPNTKTLRLLTPITIQNTVHGTTIRKPASVDLPIEVAAAANAAVGHRGKPTAEDLTQWTKFALSGALAFGTPTSTVAANLVSWGAAFTSGQEGIMQGVRIGAMYEVVIENTVTGAAGFIDVMSSDSVANRMTWVFNSANIVRIANGAGSTTLAQIGNGDAYHYLKSIVLGIRVVSARRVEVYANGVLADTFDLSFAVTRIGFSVNSTNSATASIKDVVTWDNAQPTSQRGLTVDLVGDSITYGAWSPVTWGDLLPVSAAGTPGGGGVTVRNNRAVSGTSAAQWATSGGSYDIAQFDFSGADYVLVMLGTNDGQGDAATSAFITNLDYIADTIIADGPKPIFGVFPMWTQASVSGVTGVSPTNYAGAARLRGALRRWAASKGYAVADANNLIGNNIGWLGDNIHPRAIGHAAIAKAFALALTQASGILPFATRKGWSLWVDIPVGWFANSWVIDGTAQYRTHDDGSVQFRGAVKSGTLGSTAINLGSNYLKPPLTTVRVPIACVTASNTLSMSLGEVTPAGAVTFIGGDNNRVSLDELVYSAV